MDRNISVKVNGVFNLTDARYFAAGHVSYIGFCIDENQPEFCPPDKIREIISWLEGPRFVLEVRRQETLLSLPAILASTGLNHIYLGAGIHFEDPASDLVIFKEYLLENGEFQDMNKVSYPVLSTLLPWAEMKIKYSHLLVEICQSYPCYLNVNWSDPGDFLSFVDETGAHGIILHGGAEEKTGLKNFDQMDMILELLAENS